MPEIATNEPLELRAGTTWAWRREDLTADYPASGGWALKYWFKKTGAAGANFSIDATAAGDAFAVSVLAATSAAYGAGDYTWAALVTKAAEIYEVDSGVLKVLPRYDQVANLDDRTHPRKMLAQIEAALEGFATSATVKSYTIGSRQVTRADVPDLLVLRDRYRAEVAAEDAAAGMANGLGNPRYLKTRFDRA
jgi:hypothetical protein